LVVTVNFSRLSFFLNTGLCVDNFGFGRDKVLHSFKSSRDVGVEIDEKNITL
jgi:hypothetical protein